MQHKLKKYLRCTMSIITAVVGILVMLASIIVPVNNVLGVMFPVAILFGGFVVMVLGFELFKYELKDG